MEYMGNDEPQSDDDDEMADDEAEYSDAEPPLISNANERIHFDITYPSEAGYLLDDRTEDVNCSVWLIPGRVYKIPMIVLEVVVYPGQLLPVQTNYPIERAAIVQAIKDRTYLALVSVLEGEQKSVGSLLKITKKTENGPTIKAWTIAWQRFKLINTERQINGLRYAEVEVLPEHTLTEISVAFCPDSLLRLSREKRLAIGSSISGIPLKTLAHHSIENVCRLISDWLKLWYSKAKIDSVLEMGPVHFSYWVANHMPLDPSTKYSLLEEDSADLRIHTVHSIVSQMKYLVCKSCKRKISSIADIVNMTNNGTSSLYVNTVGYIHEMVTVKSVLNFVTRGRPTAERSWFEGYKWLIIECSTCLQHLGWKFVSPTHEPEHFFGLARHSIICCREDEIV